MRILHVYPYYPPAYEYGGPVRIVEKIAENLADSGHEVEVLTTDTTGPDGRIASKISITESGVMVHRFPNVSNWLSHQIHLPLPIGALSAAVKRVPRFDVVHVHGFPHVLAVAVVRAAEFYGVPTVLTPHGSLNRDLNHTAPKRLARAAFRQGILPSVDHFTVLNKDERERVLKLGIDRNVSVITNGIDPDSILRDEASCRAFRERYDFVDSFLILFVGRLHEDKGLDVLIDVATMFKDHPTQVNVQFAVVGPDDGYESALQEMIDRRSLDSVTLLGYMDEERKSAFSAADIFLLPSRSEGQPVTVLEACSAKTPVVISEECSLPGVESEGAGRVVSLDPEEIYDCICEYIEDQQLQEESGCNARRFVFRHFSWQSTIEQYVAVYRELIE